MQNSPLESSCVFVALIENYSASKPLKVSPEKVTHFELCDTVVANERFGKGVGGLPHVSILYVSIYLYIYIYIFLYYIYQYIYICVYLYIYLYIYNYMFLYYIYICIYIFIYMYLYIYIYMILYYMYLISVVVGLCTVNYGPFLTL